MACAIPGTEPEVLLVIDVQIILATGVEIVLIDIFEKFWIWTGKPVPYLNGVLV